MKTPSKPEIERALAHSEKVGQMLDATPTWNDIQSAFPDVVIKSSPPSPEHPNGLKEATINDHTPDKRRLRLLNEMFRPKDRLSMEIGQTYHAREPEIVLKDPRGGVRYVKPHLQEAVERKTGARKKRARSSSTITYMIDRKGQRWKRVGHGDWEPDV